MDVELGAVPAAADQDLLTDDVILNIWSGSLRDGDLLVSQTLENVELADFEGLEDSPMLRRIDFTDCRYGVGSLESFFKSRPDVSIGLRTSGRVGD